jgi:hypothetical protein
LVLVSFGFMIYGSVRNPLMVEKKSANNKGA